MYDNSNDFLKLLTVFAFIACETRRTRTIQSFLSANTPLRHYEGSGRLICSVLVKMFDVLLCLAYACILYSSTTISDSIADKIKRFHVAFIHTPCFYLVKFYFLTAVNVML